MRKPRQLARRTCGSPGNWSFLVGHVLHQVYTAHIGASTTSGTSLDPRSARARAAARSAAGARLVARARPEGLKRTLFLGPRASLPNALQLTAFAVIGELEVAVM
eukprot:5753241-Prymnesium_polylepis.1